MNMMADQAPPMDARQFGSGSDQGRGSQDLQPSHVAASPTTTFNPGADVQHTTAAAPAPAASNTSAFRFDIATKTAPADRILSAPRQPRYFFGYTRANDSIQFKDVQWLSRASVSDDYQRFAPTSSQPQTLIEWDDNSALLYLDRLPQVNAGTRGSMSIRSEGGSPYRKEMVIRISWFYNGTQGYSQSGIFTVTPDVIDQDLLNDVKVWLDAPSGATAPDVIVSPQASSQAPGATQTPQFNPAPPTGSSSSISEDSGSGGGISPGAIAGIAVGGALVLALIAALAWFLLRRRRRRSQNQQAGDYKQGLQTPNAAYLDDKDMRTGQIADSPRSPYSEDGQGVPHLAALPAAATAPLALYAPTARDGAEHRHSTTAASFGPYRPDAAASRGNLTDTDVPSSAPLSVSHNVAHLVEEGMTEDQIRRLEEEERQLDDEIERAGRR
ncbi:hypothetical protein JDV02_001331 [Purpureocillium takamizusanense]|uniref:Mid2 domain-containing protein n=1 Tax=Purpureocillium takamizusanense TaxID=2060973 RepID=A0A9Q8Q7X6_9HYPO|nr:uncharacterized protein JDV02_001331 [Purpureocillium takamizusanense]UNI14730.1 hypothetical protein JDV02_001331 [Purpureocillium takamizusanense]